MLEYKKLIQKRNVWMAAAIILVFLCHLKLKSPGLFLKIFNSMGYSGVEIFFFASGLGCWYSLNKNNSASQFLKRRAKRILPTYFVFIVPWLIFRIIIKKMSVPAIIGNLFCVEYFSDRKNMAFNWYICAVMVFYIVAPYLYALVNKIKNAKQFFLLCFLCIAISVPFWNSQKFLIAVSKLPLFVIGMYVAKLSSTEKTLSKIQVAGSLIAMLAGGTACVFLNKCPYKYLYYYGLYWYPLILVIPGLCLTISLAANRIEKFRPGKFVVSCLDKLGKYTLEIYFVHIFIIEILNVFREKFNTSDGIYVICLLALTTAGVIALKSVTNIFMKIFEKISLKNKCCN